MAPYVARHAARLIEEALRDTRIVVVNGARQSGKSTLVHHLVRGRSDVAERRLDRPIELASARLDPDRFVAFDGLLVIDEIQRAPELVLPMKVRVDDDPRPGQYLLTGSARLLGLRALPDALVGRTETIELWPFSQAELAGQESTFIDRAFAGELDVSGQVADEADHETRSGYFDRVATGGFPEAHERDEARRSRFFRSYLNDLVDRDVSQLGDVERREHLDRLLSHLAVQVAQLLVMERFASALGISAKTVERYLSLCEEVFLVKPIPAWVNSATTRAIHTRKLLFVDSGLATFLCGRNGARLDRGDPMSGPALENFVLSELARLAPMSGADPSLFHYRNRDGIEVDAVLERRDGTVVGVEVKAAESVRPDDLRGLTHLRDKADEDFAAGVIFYTGRVVRPVGDRLWAVPIDRLWTAPTQKVE